MARSFSVSSLCAAASVSLIACGGGGAGPSGSVAPVDNGLPYATEGMVLDDFRDQRADVTVVRHVFDYATGTPRIVVGTAVLEVGALQGDGPLVYVDPTMTLTLDGETLEFVNGTATDESGRIWSAYVDTTGTVSGTAGIYHYDYGGANGFDTEGVFAFGFLTDPAELAARSGNATYAGSWYGYGVVTDGAGGILANEAIGGGAIRLVANFDTPGISGGLTGSYDSFGRVDGSFDGTRFTGNAFELDLVRDCAAGESCASGSVVGGAFFGVDGIEISGAIGFDEVRRLQSGETIRLISSAGYTAPQAAGE